MRTRATLVRSTDPYGLSLGTAAGVAGGGSAHFRVEVPADPHDTGGMHAELFALPKRETLSDGATLLRGFARDDVPQLLADIEIIRARSPFRHMIVPTGQRMSVAMTNAGIGWITDRSGYRYDTIDPETDRPWPAMPDSFHTLAARAATAAGYPGFTPDGCLINRYAPGSRLTLHQDRNESDFSQPIVSVSLGLPAKFLWGGAARRDRPRRIRLSSGDVVVWGGQARLTFHGIDTLADGSDALTGPCRINLTFRKAR
jgi:alkylated DNA repair protein (DNA oxidative demethylase)